MNLFRIIELSFTQVYYKTFTKVSDHIRYFLEKTYKDDND